MSRENVEVVERIFDRFAAGDVTTWMKYFAEDVVWDVSASDLPVAAETYRGHRGVVEFFAEWLAEWEDPTLELLEAVDAGESVVIVFSWRGRGKTSGIPVDRVNFGVYDLHDGLIVGYRQYETRAEALAAAGM